MENLFMNLEATDTNTINFLQFKTAKEKGFSYFYPKFLPKWLKMYIFPLFFLATAYKKGKKRRKKKERKLESYC